MLLAGAEASWIWCCSLMYCNDQPQRDGFIPDAVVPCLFPMRRPRKVAEKLIEVGLWERVQGGYRIHDYCQYQPNTEQSQALSEKRREAGQKGGTRSGEARAKQSASSKHAAQAKPGASSKPEANPKQVVEANANPIPSILKTVDVVAEEPRRLVVTAGAEQPPPQPQPRRPLLPGATPADQFEPSEVMLRWAKSLGLDDRGCDQVTLEVRDKHGQRAHTLDWWDDRWMRFAECKAQQPQRHDAGQADDFLGGVPVT